MSVEQRINLKFLVHLGKTPTEALKSLDYVIRKENRTLWHHHFCHQPLKTFYLEGFLRLQKKLFFLDLKLVMY